MFSGRTIDVPSCFISGASDWGIHQRPGALEAMQRRACTQMIGCHLIEGAGHWVQQEQPRARQRIADRFLARSGASGNSNGEAKQRETFAAGGFDDADRVACARPNEPELRDITLGGLLEWAAATTPDRIALIAGVPDRTSGGSGPMRSCTRSRSGRARALRARFEPGERVAIWAHNIPEWIMMEFGAAMAGVILVTVNPGCGRRRSNTSCNQSRAAGIARGAGFRGNRMLRRSSRSSRRTAGSCAR